MKKRVGIWLDTDKAVVVSLFPEGEDVQTIYSMVDTRVRYPGERKAYHRLGSMFVNPTKKSTNRKKHQMHHYFDSIIELLHNSSDILIFGPSTVKVEFEKELKKHHVFDQTNITLSSADKMTPKQTVAFVKNKFNTKASVHA